MSDAMIRAAFEHGADDVVPSDGMWERVEKEIALREAASQVSPWKRNWRRLAVAAVLLLALGFGLTPQARAVVEQFQVIWSGMVGGKEAVVTYAPASERKNPITWEQVADVEEAEEMTGLIAPVIEQEGFTLRGASAMVTPLPDGWEGRGIMLYYQRNGETGYTVARLAGFKDGEFRPIENMDIQIFGGVPPTEARPVTQGDIAALCIDWEGEPRTTVCEWRPDGYQIAVGGPDAAVVESLVGQVR